ncbi:MAG: hypothetical protein WCI41_02100 [bacterium]
MTNQEAEKIANEDGFSGRFKMYRESLKFRIESIEFLRLEMEKIDRINNPEAFNYLVKFSDNIYQIIKDEEQEFMTKDGETLKQLEAWVEAVYG